MVQHHPPTDFLTEYAAGALPVAQSACVAAHLSYCQRCRQSVEKLEDIGGAHFEQLDPQPVGESVLERVMARLDDPQPLRYARNERCTLWPILGPLNDWKRLNRVIGHRMNSEAL